MMIVGISMQFLCILQVQLRGTNKLFKSGVQVSTLIEMDDPVFAIKKISLEAFSR